MTAKLCARLFALAAIASLTFACSNAEVSAFQAWGKKHKITLYGCNGQIVQQWESSGKIENEANSNGYYFTDDKTQKLVMVDGTVVIEVE